jgi:dihydroorotate dehydrogenase (NAD+) catalytic subunit
VLASIIPGATEHLPELARDVEAAGVRWLELNLSAPHAGEAPAGAIERPVAPARVQELTSIVREAVSIPLTVKLGAESADVTALAGAASRAGADAIAMVGRHMGFVPDPETRRAVLDSFGGYSGSWALPIAMRWVAKTRLALGPRTPLIGTNGARSGIDVASFMLAGASAVQVATSVLREGFGALGRMLAELTDYLQGQGRDAGQIVGEATDAALSYADAAARRRR